MATATNLDGALRNHRCWFWRTRTRASRFANSVREGLEVIAAMGEVVRIEIKPHHIPTARRGQRSRVGVAQVVAMGFSGLRERAEHSRAIGVDVRQRRYRTLPAGGTGTRTLQTHVATVPRHTR